MEETDRLALELVLGIAGSTMLLVLKVALVVEVLLLLLVFVFVFVLVLVLVLSGCTIVTKLLLGVPLVLSV